jgi:hypothetical protein
VEMAIVADEPAHQREEELAERRVDVEEVGALEVVGCELHNHHTLAHCPLLWFPPLSP